MPPPPVHGHVGLSRRELERELEWLFKRLPDDPRALVKLIGQAVVTLIEKNNAAIAQSLADRDHHPGPAKEP